MVLYAWLPGGGGGGAVQGNLSPPPPSWITKNNFYAHSTCFKLSEYEIVSAIFMMQDVNLSGLSCYPVSHTWLQGLR